MWISKYFKEQSMIFKLKNWQERNDVCFTRFVSIFLKCITVRQSSLFFLTGNICIQSNGFSNKGSSVFKMFSLSLVNVFATAELLSLSVFDHLVPLQNDSYSNFFINSSRFLILQKQNMCSRFSRPLHGSRRDLCH